MKPARILMVVNAEWYFWSHRLALARGLRARGHDVIVAAGIERGMATRIESEGFRFVSLPFVRGRVSLPAEVRAFVALCRLYRRERPDVVYHTTIKPILYGSFAARLVGISRKVNAIPGLGHVFAAEGMAGRCRRWLAAWLYRRALSGRLSRVIFQNADDRRVFVDQKIARPEHSVVIRGSGVDLTQFSPFSSEPEAAPAGAPIILLASRLLWDKGVGELVEATRQLRRAHLQFRTVIVGIPDENNPKAIPVSALEGWQREGLIEWWGLRADMPEVLSQAAIVALPSYYPEGVPKILLEAAAAGRPIVTTDTPGCREAVIDGRTGILVPPRDVDRLAAALQRLLDDPELRIGMGIASRKLAEEQFGEERVVAESIRLFDTLLLQT